MPVRGLQGTFVCFLDFVTEGGGVGDQVSGDTTTVDIQTDLLNMSLKSASFNDETFLAKNKTSGLENTLLKC